MMLELTLKCKYYAYQTSQQLLLQWNGGLFYQVLLQYLSMRLVHYHSSMHESSPFCISQETFDEHIQCRRASEQVHPVDSQEDTIYHRQADAIHSQLF